MKPDRVPDPTITRLSRYCRCLAQLEASGVDTISSQRLAERLGIDPAQVRKDLAYFGQFGRRGLGYEVRNLRSEIVKILGLDREWKVAIVGAGHLGVALATYKGFEKQRFKVVALFDKDSRKIDKRIGGIKVYPLTRLSELVEQKKVMMGIIAVPAEAAQEVANRLVKAGIKTILNFAPVRLTLPAEVKLRNVDLSIELESLSYYLTHSK